LKVELNKAFEGLELVAGRIMLLATIGRAVLVFGACGANILVILGTVALLDDKDLGAAEPEIKRKI
jgi:Ca2+/Na+ antiporter